MPDEATKRTASMSWADDRPASGRARGARHGVRRRAERGPASLAKERPGGPAQCAEAGRERPVPGQTMDSALEGLRAYLQAAGYRALSNGAWPPRVIGAYANDECDGVLLMKTRFGCLELRPFDVCPAGLSETCSRARRPGWASECALAPQSLSQ